VRQGRRNEFRHFGWGGEVPDPQAEETFAASRVVLSRAAQGEHAQMHRLYRDLIRLRRHEPALRPGAARVEVYHDAEAGWIAVLLDLQEAGKDLLAVYNLSKSPHEVELELPSRRWALVLSTDDAFYGGPRVRTRPMVDADVGGRLRFELPEETAALYCSEAV
jgi:1,4-alpha-glucan branching enzyme